MHRQTDGRDDAGPAVSDATPGRRIKARRMLLGLDQKDLAKKAGLGVTRLSGLENDHNFPALKVGTLVRICEVLDCSLDYLVSGKEPT